VILWLAACAFHVPPPAGGEMVSLPLVAPPEDTDRPYTLLQDHLWFVDTGASRTTCDDDFVASLGIPTHATLARTRGEVGTVPVRLAVLHDVDIGGWHFARLPCAVRDLGTTSSIPEDPANPVAGVLGANLLRHFVVDFDFGGATFRLHPEGDVPAEGGARLRRENGFGPRLLATLEVDGAPIEVVIDTGADRTYLPLTSGAELQRYMTEHQGTGPGGATAMEIVVRAVGSATVDGLELPVHTYVQRKGRPGLLGMDALRGGRVWVDVPGRRLYVEVGP
jgi:predicted aspartyl protease